MNPWLVVAMLGLAGDWAQTRDIAKRPTQFHELNPILGLHPSEGAVNSYFAVAAGSTLLIGQSLPHKWQPWFYGGIAALEVVMIMKNRRAGIGFNFHI